MTSVRLCSKKFYLKKNKNKNKSHLARCILWPISFLLIFFETFSFKVHHWSCWSAFDAMNESVLSNLVACNGVNFGSYLMMNVILQKQHIHTVHTTYRPSTLYIQSCTVGKGFFLHMLDLRNSSFSSVLDTFIISIFVTLLSKCQHTHAFI